LDNSVLVPLFFTDESSKYSFMAIGRAKAGARLMAPRLAVIEFGSAVLNGTRNKRITVEVAQEALEAFGELPIEFVETFPVSQLARIVALGRRRSLSAYDATYLALAIDEGARLATLDGHLRNAALAEGIEVIGDDE
jgi:predicted nucleic acid-binding protein